MVRPLPGQPAPPQLPDKLVPRAIVETNRHVRRRISLLAISHELHHPFQGIRAIQQWSWATRSTVLESIDDRLRSYLEVDNQVASPKAVSILKIDKRSAAGADHLV